MFHRIVSPILKSSFFLFGPRGTGKTTLLKELFSSKEILWIDLLDPEQEERYARHPDSLSHEIQTLGKNARRVVIDEIQKLPKLLELVHFHIENSNVLFALTGSSARKLKKGAANLLAGRAFVNHLFPLTFLELGNRFDLNHALQWGTLPKTFQLSTGEERNEFLRAYALTYLKEEVWTEHLIRQLDPFRRFLEIAAQANGEILNYSNIALDVGVDTKTVQSYFEILEDTLLGVLLEPYHRSVRKRQRKNPKFYFFDPGVKRALEKTLSVPLLSQTYAYGRAFEHFLILEAHRLNSYFRKDFSFFYLRTKDGAGVDLIVERPGRPPALVEIKSSDRIGERDVAAIERFAGDFKKAQAFCFSRDPRPKKIGSVEALPWQQGLEALGLTGR